MLGTGRVPGWMNNEWALDVTGFLKVSLVPSEVPVWRSWQMHLSRASSIVRDRKQRCSRPSFTTAPTPWGPLGRNRHAHASFRCDKIRGRPSLSPAPALHLRDPSRSCWTDAVFNIKALAFFGVDRGVPGCPFPPTLARQPLANQQLTTLWCTS